MRMWARLSLVWRFAIVSLVVVALLGLVLARILGSIISRQALDEAGERASDTLSARVVGELSRQDLREPMMGARYWEFRRFVEESVVSERTAHIRIWNRDGTLIYSPDPTDVAGTYFPNEHLVDAFDGDTVSYLPSSDEPESAVESRFGPVITVYTPIAFLASPEPLGAIEILQYYEPVAAQIAETQRYLYGGLAGGLAFLYLALFVVVNGGEKVIRRQRAELELYAGELEESQRQTLLAIASALDLRDRETQHHSVRVQRVALAIGRKIPLSAEDDATLGTAALLHDVGKIGVPDHILSKPGPLTSQEWHEMKKHPELGYDFLKDFEFLRPVAKIVYAHHERFDGSGYPRGLAGERIPLCARVFAVADAYEAMTCDRRYRKAVSHEEAVEEIRRNAGTQFDPRVVEAFLKAMEDRPVVIAEFAPSAGLPKAA